LEGEGITDHLRLAPISGERTRISSSCPLEEKTLPVLEHLPIRNEGASAGRRKGEGGDVEQGGIRVGNWRD